MTSREWPIYLFSTVAAVSVTLVICLLAERLHVGSLAAGWTLALGFALSGIVSTRMSMHGSAEARIFWGLGVRVFRSLAALAVMALVLLLSSADLLSFLLASVTGCYAALFSDGVVLCRMPQDQPSTTTSTC